MEVPGHRLYLPMTRMKGRFIMIEEDSKLLYDMDLITERLGNPGSWKAAGLEPSTISRKFAIVIPIPLDETFRRELAARGGTPEFETGKFVCIQREEPGIIFGTIVGNVNICPFDESVMSWEKLKEYKGHVIHDEMRNGLLASLYGHQNTNSGFVHPEILANMRMRWHERAELLNAELDGIWASGKRINTGGAKWMFSE